MPKILFSVALALLELLPSSIPKALYIILPPVPYGDELGNARNRANVRPSKTSVKSSERLIFPSQLSHQRDQRVSGLGAVRSGSPCLLRP